MKSSKQIKTIDQYIAQFPNDVQAILQKIRQTIKKAAPKAEEAISYMMPTFKLHGNLIHFAAYKNHIGIYPTPSGITAFKELRPYVVGKGSARFPLDERIPYDVIKKLAVYRVKTSQAEHQKKTIKKKH